MSNQQPIQIILFELKSKSTQAAGIIHGEECSKNQFAVLEQLTSRKS